MEEGSGEVCGRRCVRGGAVVADCLHAFFFSGDLGSGGVGVLSYEVAAGVDEFEGGCLFDGHVEPGVGPLDGDGGVGVDASYAEGEGVDSAMTSGICIAAT